jgi:hypothetical protein
MELRLERARQDDGVSGSGLEMEWVGSGMGWDEEAAGGVHEERRARRAMGRRERGVTGQREGEGGQGQGDG